MLFGSIFAYSLPLIEGSGNAFVDLLTTYKSGTQPRYYSSQLNRLAQGGFESGNLTADGWSTTGGTPPDASRANSRGGKYAMRLRGMRGETNSASLQVSCLPGQGVAGEVWAAAVGFTSKTHLTGVITFVDAAGNGLLSNGFMDVIANQPYTRMPFSTHVRAPAGTRAVVLSLSIFGTTSGTPIGYVDDVTLNVQ
jgi:hypothetical protein